MWADSEPVCKYYGFEQKPQPCVTAEVRVRPLDELLFDVAYKLDSLTIIWFIQKEGGAIGINSSTTPSSYNPAICWKLM
jgi:hypothetical protein